MKIVSLINPIMLVGLSVASSRRLPTDTIEQQIIASEREELDALKTGDTKRFAGLIADDAIFVDPTGTASKQEVVSHVSDLRLLVYSMENVRYVAISADSGAIAYKLTEKASSQGSEFTHTVYASAVWVRRDGKWLSVFSQETPVRAQQ